MIDVAKLELIAIRVEKMSSDPRTQGSKLFDDMSWLVKELRALALENEALVSILAVMIRDRRDEDVVGVLMKEGALYFVKELGPLAERIEATIKRLDGGWS